MNKEGKHVYNSQLVLSLKQKCTSTCKKIGRKEMLHHLQCCHKLNSADECQGFFRREVELYCVQEMCIVHLDIHKHIQHLNACSGIYGNCRKDAEKRKGRWIIHSFMSENKCIICPIHGASNINVQKILRHTAIWDPCMRIYSSQLASTGHNWKSFRSSC